LRELAAALSETTKEPFLSKPSNPGFARKGNVVQNTNQNLCSIIVLSDGETWSRFGKVLTITENAYTRLFEGAKIRDLDENDIVKRYAV
jgi:hypothetical protein